MRIGLCCLIIITGLGCTKATPEFEMLDEDSVPRPTFNGLTVKSVVTADGSETFTISGECDRKIRDIHGSALGTVSAFSWSNASVAGLNMTCAVDGKFSFVLKSLTDLGYTITENTVYEIQIRGETKAGISKPSSIKILFSTSAGRSRPVVVTSGGVHGAADGLTASGTFFKAEIRATNKVIDITGPATDADQVMMKTGTGFKARVGIRNNYAN